MMLLEPAVSPASFLGAHPTVPQTLRRETRAHQKCKGPAAHESLGPSWDTPEPPRAAQRLDVSVWCRQNKTCHWWCHFRQVNHEDSNNQSCRGFTEPMSRMSGTEIKQGSWPLTRPQTCRAPAACSSQEPPLCSQR